MLHYPSYFNLFLSGLEYSAGEGTNYPPKFESAPGETLFMLLLKLCLSITKTKLDSFVDSQVPGGLPQRSGVQRTGMKMWVFSWSLTIYSTVLSGSGGVYIFPSKFILFFLFCFFPSAAIRDQNFHSLQCGINSSASRECYNHQRTEVGHWAEQSKKMICSSFQ